MAARSAGFLDCLHEHPRPGAFRIVLDPRDSGCQRNVGLHHAPRADQESAGTVALELQPRWADRLLLVEVSANTHSVDLATLDLAGDVRLVVDEVEYAPVEAGSLSRHHARATLRFEVPERPAAFRIMIQDVPDPPLRILSWPGDD